MNMIRVVEADTQLARLLDQVGAGDQIAITRHGIPVACMVPLSEHDQALHDTIARLKDFGQGQTLGGLKARDLIDDGRR